MFHSGNIFYSFFFGRIIMAPCTVVVTRDIMIGRNAVLAIDREGRKEGRGKYYNAMMDSR